MKRFIAVLVARRTPIYFRLAALVLATIAAVLSVAAPMPASAQHPSVAVCKDNDATANPNAKFPCYLKPTADGGYGFNAGSGRGGDHDRALEWGTRYSVDRCALAHDRSYWGNGLPKEGAGSKQRCSNDLGFYRCVQFVRPEHAGSNAGNEILAAVAATALYKTALLFSCTGQDYPYAHLPMELNKFHETDAIPWKAALVQRALTDCRQVFAGSFFDPRKGGECWTCPDGYGRVAFPPNAVTASNACEKGGPFGDHKRAKFRGRLGCPSGSFQLGLGCFRCPPGTTPNPGFPNPLLEFDHGVRFPNENPNFCMYKVS